MRPVLRPLLLAALVQIFGGCATSSKTQSTSPTPSAQSDPCDPNLLKPKPPGLTAKDAGFALLGLPLAPIWAIADSPQALHQGSNQQSQSSPETWAEACRPCVQLAHEALAKYPSDKWRYHGCECIMLDAGRPYVDPAPASSAWGP